MCGRYYSLFDKQQVAEHFDVRPTADNVGIIAPNYNVAPGDPQPVVRRSRDTGERELVMMRWGIVPWFAKSEPEFKKLSTINAKSDRLTDSKMWREPFAKRRCLVPASGLYEWPKPGHAISDTYSEEETVLPPTARNRSLSLEISLVRRRKRRGKQKRPSPSSASSASLWPSPARSPSPAFGTHGSGWMEHTLRRSPWLPPNPMNSSPKSTTVLPSSCTRATTTAG